MAEVMEMLALSPTMEEGTLADWLKSEGDKVSEGDIIAEVETDKATMEMESFYSGVILKLLAKPGDTVTVGSPLIVIGEEGEDIEALLKDLGAGGLPSKEEKETRVQAEEQPAEADKVEAKEEKPSEPTDDGARLKASPLARRMADDEGIKLAEVSGSGPGGRIIKRDIEEAMKRPAPSAAKARPGAAPAVSAELIPVPEGIPGEQVPLSQMRKAIARRLVQVWQSTPHFYLTMDIDMAQAMEQRKAINAGLKDAGVEWKVSVNDMIIKACASALERYPKMNVAYQGDYIYQFEEANIGVAVAVEEGLITPTIRNADQKSLGQIAREARELAGRARDKKLKPEEYSSHTFSVSNLGMYGIDNFLAVLNPPDAGILACGAVQQVPVVDNNGQLVVGTRMKITLACDHRAVDGAVGAEFLQHVKTYLENPLLLMV